MARPFAELVGLLALVVVPVAYLLLETAVERLRAWRSQAAQAQSVPAYVVFTDATLQAIAETRPAPLTVPSISPLST